MSSPEHEQISKRIQKKMRLINWDEQIYKHYFFLQMIVWLPLEPRKVLYVRQNDTSGKNEIQLTQKCKLFGSEEVLNKLSAN